MCHCVTSNWTVAFSLPHTHSQQFHCCGFLNGTDDWGDLIPQSCQCLDHIDPSVQCVSKYVYYSIFIAEFIFLQNLFPNIAPALLDIFQVNISFHLTEQHTSEEVLQVYEQVLIISAESMKFELFCLFTQLYVLLVHSFFTDLWYKSSIHTGCHHGPRC